MIPLAIITAFLTTIISLFFNSISEAWTSLKAETKEVYATNVQTFIEEVRKDFADKPTKRRMKEPDDFEGNPDNDTILSKQQYFEGMGKDRNGFRKNQGRKGQSGPTMGRYSDQKVFTLSKGMERNQWRNRHINHDQ